ncbi:MAG: hypothetical protein Q9223_007206, partial [Gallowayella weberi]
PTTSTAYQRKVYLRTAKPNLLKCSRYAEGKDVCGGLRSCVYMRTERQNFTISPCITLLHPQHEHPVSRNTAYTSWLSSILGIAPGRFRPGLYKGVKTPNSPTLLHWATALSHSPPTF